MILTYENSIIFFIVTCIIMIFILLKYALFKTKQNKQNETKNIR